MQHCFFIELRYLQSVLDLGTWSGMILLNCKSEATGVQILPLLSTFNVEKVYV